MTTTGDNKILIISASLITTVMFLFSFHTTTTTGAEPWQGILSASVFCLFFVCLFHFIVGVGK